MAGTPADNVMHPGRLNFSRGGQAFFVQFAIAHRQTGNRRPLISRPQYFVHFIHEFSLRVIVPPPPAVAKFDEVLLPTFDEGEPSARDIVVRRSLPFRHEKPEALAYSARRDIRYAMLIRQLK